MSDHTEKWIQSGNGVWIETDPGCGGPDPQPPEGERIGGFNTEDQAERAVACVNALEGINPEAVPKMVEALENYKAEQTNAVKDYTMVRLRRDQLFHALKLAKGEE